MESINRGAPPVLEIIRQDAARAFRIIKSGGVVILPLDVSYAIFGHTARAVERIYALKQRPSSKPNAVLGNKSIFENVMITTARDKELVECITVEYNLPCRSWRRSSVSMTGCRRPSSARFGARPRATPWICC